MDNETNQAPKKKDPKITLPDLGAELAATEPFTLDLVNPQPKIEGLRLNLGCGNDPKSGFINVDLYDKAAEAPWDLRKLPLNDNSIAQIISYETLEHIPQNDVLPAIKEWYRVLKPNGTVVIIVPDLKSACERILADPEDEWAVARLFGNQSHEGQFHKAGFTPKRLNSIFGFAGFRVIAIALMDQGNGVQNIVVEATK